MRHVITNADQVDKFAEIPGDFDGIAIGDGPAPWRPYQLADTVAPSAIPLAHRSSPVRWRGRCPVLATTTPGTWRAATPTATSPNIGRKPNFQTNRFDRDIVLPGNAVELLNSAG